MLSMDNYRPNFTQGNFLLFIFHLFSSNQSLKQGYITQNSTFKFFFLLPNLLNLITELEETFQDNLFQNGVKMMQLDLNNIPVIMKLQGHSIFSKSGSSQLCLGLCRHRPGHSLGKNLNLFS